MKNPCGQWKSVKGNDHQKTHYIFHYPNYAVYGTIFYKKEKNMYEWEARVMLNCRIGAGSIRGYAKSVDNAKKIVETLCYETDTCNRKADVKKDNLYYSILYHVESGRCKGANIPASRESIYDIFFKNGKDKLEKMIEQGIVLEASNGMLGVDEEYKNDI